MPATPHEVVLLAIREQPELFAEVFRRVVGVDIPGPIEVIDSNVRFAASLETRPDLIVRTPGASSRWMIIELQNRKDEDKCRSWLLAASVLLQRDGMGDLVVITSSRGVAAWAKAAAHHRGERGTSLGLTPVIPETKASRAFWRFFEARAGARVEARGEVKGKKQALLAVLTARGLSPSREERAAIAALTDLAMLDRCIQAAVTADSVRAALAGARATPRRRAAPARASRPSPTRTRSRRTGRR
jgi:hypothetical protein